MIFQTRQAEFPLNPENQIVVELVIVARLGTSQEAGQTLISRLRRSDIISRSIRCGRRTKNAGCHASRVNTGIKARPVSF